MDTNKFHVSPAESRQQTRRPEQLALTQQRSELLHLQQENARLRAQVLQLESRLADLRQMVHDFLLSTDPV